MNKIILILTILIAFSCKENNEKKMSAQEIVDKSIEVTGGKTYENSTIAFDFRDRNYMSITKNKRQTLTRYQKNDTIDLKDVLSPSGFVRYQNDTIVSLHDSLATKYGNSVNSVHYFSKIPYGLNDPAANKELLGETMIKEKPYFKVKVTFDKEGGGDDFDDTYVYFFNKETFKPDYLAYDFHVDGGGMRFREAYNERYVNGIRFVDYNNMKPINFGASVLEVDSLFNNDMLKLLSKIELKNLEVTLGSYN